MNHTYGFLAPEDQKISFITVENVTLELLQKEVNGYIECITNPFHPTYRDHSLVAIVNEDGALIDLPANILTIAGMTRGNVLFLQRSKSKLLGLKKEQIKFLKSIKKL